MYKPASCKPLHLLPARQPILAYVLCWCMFQVFSPCIFRYACFSDIHIGICVATALSGNGLLNPRLSREWRNVLASWIIGTFITNTSARPQCRILVSLVLLWFMYQVLSPALFGMHPFLRGIVAFAIFPILNSLAVETATLVIRSPDDCVDFISFYCFICLYIIMVMLFLVYWVSQFWKSAPNCWFGPRRMLTWIRLMSQLFGISSMHRYSCHQNCLAISRNSYLNAIVSLLLGSLAKIFLFRQLALFSRSTF